MDPRLFYVSETRTPAFEELSLVSLTRALEVGDDQKLPAGSVGTIVGILKEGVAYVVEFTEPFAALVDIEVGEFEPLPAEFDDDPLAKSMDHRAS